MFERKELLEIEDKFFDRLERWRVLTKADKCFKCSKKIEWIIKMPKDSETEFRKRINQEFLFHLSDTHGLMPEFIVGELFEYFMNGRSSLLFFPEE